MSPARFHTFGSVGQRGRHVLLVFLLSVSGVAWSAETTFSNPSSSGGTQAGSLSGLDPQAVGTQTANDLDRTLGEKSPTLNDLSLEWVNHLVRKASRNPNPWADQIAQDHRSQHDRHTTSVMLKLKPDRLTVDPQQIPIRPLRGMWVTSKAEPRNNSLTPNRGGMAVPVGPSVRFREDARDGAGGVNRVRGEQE